MKSIVIRLALALAAFTVVPNAFADAYSGNFFVDAKVGKMFGKVVAGDSDFTNNSPTSWGADGGYTWKVDDAHSLGLDVGYMHFGHILDEFGGNEFFTAEISASAMTAGGHFRVRFGDDKAWLVQARAGFMSLKSDENFDSFPPDGSADILGSNSWRQSGMYFGLGIGRNITQDVSLILAYDHYGSNDTQDQNGGHPALDLNWIGLEAEYRF